ncbi:hypothetical protein ACUN22_17160 [Streptomyces anulatus]|uniref:hypothetical protein n=1 Tax=Streptomyces anulatus TaxID=1892 RepID=UPI00403E2CF8
MLRRRQTWCLEHAEARGDGSSNGFHVFVPPALDGDAILSFCGRPALSDTVFAKAEFKGYTNYEGLVACSIEFRWPWWTTLPLVIAATLSSPPLNAALRSSWRHLATDEAQLKAVHSADSVLEEAGFVLAPLAAGVAIALLGPRHAYEAAAACFITVTVLYLAAARRHQLGTTRATPSSNTSRPGRDGRRGRRWLGALAVPGMTAILLPLLVMGCVFGGTSVLVPAYIQHQHATFWLGPLLAATSIGGILYATLEWKAGLWRKYQLLTLGFTLPATLLFLARPLWLLASLLFLAGLFVTPPVHQLLPPHRRHHHRRQPRRGEHLGRSEHRHPKRHHGRHHRHPRRTPPMEHRPAHPHLLRSRRRNRRAPHLRPPATATGHRRRPTFSTSPRTSCRPHARTARPPAQRL